ncbi:hypothetical protein EDC04DRAFT_3092806 [Pisolithus marmoratus]|nr:hypothetical protein EDC04DRAFT_3092806 [Pisolithus marmoratus]
MKDVALAVDDAKESLQVQPSPIGHIAMAVALLGQSDRGGALCTFDLAFHDCQLHDIRFLLLLKSILVFESGDHNEAVKRITHLVTRANDDNDDEATYLYTQVLGTMYMKQEQYGDAISSIERAKKLAPKDKQCLSLKTISLIFGWSFNELDIETQQHLCESLYTAGRTVEAVKILLNIIRTSEDEIRGSKETVDWIEDFRKKCATTLEQVGDEAFRSVKYEDATISYSAALSLNPPSPAGLLIKRSKARAEKGLWEDALQDANEAVNVDRSYPWGYEAKHAALHGAKRYDEAIDAFESMLHAIEQSADPAIRLSANDGLTELRNNYISRAEVTAVIDPIVDRILECRPLVVINIATGCLCERPEWIRIFKDGQTFKELVSSMTRELKHERIRQVVEGFFGYVMFSHAWDGHEPSYQDLKKAESVWKLPHKPLNRKLRNFCQEVRRLGHNWAWSDTCCIDKDTSSILNQSLTSMYTWYAYSAATLVFLADVAHPSKLGDLRRSHWMTRAWTLQELLAPKVIFFYDSKWKQYLGDTGSNHKESPAVMQELADAIKIPRETIITFSPDDLGAREKLRLASTRTAKVREDIAYALIGIFKSDIRPHYGEGDDALGHLLEEIVTRSGDVSVLAWSGKSSSYNSCLPDSISVYSQTPYNPLPLEGKEMEACITELRHKSSKVERIFTKISCLAPASFAARRLHLPCISFPVKALNIHKQPGSNEKSYSARVSGLGIVEFTSTDDLLLHESQKFVFAHPWIRHIRALSSEVVCENDSELDTDSDLGSGRPRVGENTRALHMIARLGQPFNALLLAQQSNGDYKRVAAESEIVVPGFGAKITSRNIGVKVLEIL